MDIVSYLLGKNAGGGGGNLDEYFNTEITKNTTIDTPAQVVKKTPDINVADNVTNLTGAFKGATFSPKVIMGNNVTNCSYMFYQVSVSSLDVSTLNTENVTDMSNMFYGCEQLETLDVSNFDVAKVTNFSNMFGACVKLTELDLSSFHTKTNAFFTSMFYYCTSLTRLDIRNFDFTNAFTGSMFGNSASDGVPNNCLIIVKDDDTKTLLQNSFSRLTNIKTVAEL